LLNTGLWKYRSSLEPNGTHASMEMPSACKAATASFFIGTGCSQYDWLAASLY